MQRPKGVAWAPGAVTLFALFWVIFGTSFRSTFSCILEPKMGPEIAQKWIQNRFFLSLFLGLFFEAS